MPSVENPSDYQYEIQLDSEKSPEWVSLKNGVLIADKPPKKGSYKAYVNIVTEKDSFTGQYFGGLPPAFIGQTVTREYEVPITVKTTDKKVTMTKGPSSLSNIRFNYSEKVKYAFDQSASKELGEDSSLVTVTPKFKEDLGFSYELNYASSSGVSFDPSFISLNDYA